ncbi:stage III sporulation protein AE [Bariatricus sp. SGI.154]|uniref:stage III sporulation protein AE n=1 Tax=Bariatricus sp. SGI.154 TaxID=3420549 RepID=UPI003CFCB63A
MRRKGKACIVILIPIVCIMLGFYFMPEVPADVAHASDIDPTLDLTQNSDSEEVDQTEMEEQLVDQFDFDEIDDSLKELFPGEKLEFKETLLGILSGDVAFSAKLLNQLIADQFSYAFRTSKNHLMHMLLIAIIAAVFSNFSRVFQSRQISEISFYALYMLLIALTLSSFEVVVDWVSEGIEGLTSFMGVFCPLYFLAVAVAKGSVTSVAFYNLVLFLIYLVELLITNFLLPVIHIYMMVKVLNYLSQEEYLSKFAELIELAVSWILKTMLACIVGLNVMQGLISPAIDTVKRSVLTRGAEAIPGVGDLIGGMAEVAIGTAVLVKNGIGMAGAVICVALCIVPMVQIACIVLLYKLSAAIIQPVSDKRIVGCIETVGEGCQLLLKVVFTTAVLFLLTIVIVAAVTGNI